VDLLLSSSRPTAAQIEAERLITNEAIVNGIFTGKGRLAIPWLQDRGWRILFAGYQVILMKDLHNRAPQGFSMTGE